MKILLSIAMCLLVVGSTLTARSSDDSVLDYTGNVNRETEASLTPFLQNSAVTFGVLGAATLAIFVAFRRTRSH